jgi:aminopeptidase N
MKNKFILLLISCCIAFSAKPQSIDTRHIKLDLKFDWSKKQASGEAEITLNLLEAGNKIFFDAGNLTIYSVSQNKKQVKYNYNGSDTSKLEILLDKLYQPKETIVVKISYHTNYVNESDPNAIGGSFGKGLRFFTSTFTTPKKQKQIWSHGEPAYTKYWMPCNDKIEDICTTEIMATVEKPLLFLSNGNLISKKDNGNGTQTFHYKTKNEHSLFLTSFVVGEYADVVQNEKKIPIHTYAYTNETNEAKATTALLPDMLQFIENKTGVKYPFTQYAQVVVQDYPFPGLCGQHGLSTLSDNYIDDYGVHKDFKYLWDPVAAQALASQWFGNYVMIKNWGDMWLNAGFTQYVADQYHIYNKGQTEYLMWVNWPFQNAAVLGDWNANYRHPIVQKNVTDISAFTTDNYAKHRAALVLRILQKEVGEKKWWKAINKYLTANAFKQVTTKNFQSAIELTTGKSYQWFFDQWFYKTGLPKFEVSKKYYPDKKQLEITIKQTQQKDTATTFEQVDYFQGHVDVEIDNNIETIYLASKPVNIILLPLNKEPQFVHFDFENTWLKEISYKKNAEEYIQQLLYSKDGLARQMAIDSLAKIARQETILPQEKNKILEALKKIIVSNEYWRLRTYAIANHRGILAGKFDEATIGMWKQLIEKEYNYVKVSAIFSLGNTKDTQYDDIYIKALNDSSDRVINAAAIALGKSKSPKAYDALITLDKKPSWKNQSRISALAGLKELGDERAVDYALQCIKDNTSARWYLATPTWDYPLQAAITLAAFKKGNLAYPTIFERFKKSMQENDVNDIFSNTLLIATLGDERGREIFTLLKEKYKNDANAMVAVNNYEAQFLESIK